jgi:hypothetical protein
MISFQLTGQWYPEGVRQPAERGGATASARRYSTVFCVKDPFDLATIEGSHSCWVVRHIVSIYHYKRNVFVLQGIRGTASYAVTRATSLRLLFTFRTHILRNTHLAILLFPDGLGGPISTTSMF